MRPVLVSAILLLGCGSSAKKDLPPLPTFDSGSNVVNPLPDTSAADLPGPADGAAGNTGSPDIGAPMVADAADAAPGGADAVAIEAPGPSPDTTAPATDAGPDLPPPHPVTLQFAGTVATVANNPLGLDSTARTAPVTGTLTYDLRTPDLLPADPKRGRFLHGTTSAFTFTVLGHTIEGSTYAVMQTEDLDPDTIRFMDGPGIDPLPRTMKLDGMPAPMLKLWIAITDSSGAMLKNDSLPDPFPVLDIAKTPHTFSIEDGGGTLLMQLTSLTQR